MTQNGGLTLNGVGLSAFGARVAPMGAGHERAGDVIDLILQAADGRIGDILLDDDPAITDLAVRQTIEIAQPTSALLLAAFDRLKGHCLSGPLTLVYDDLPTRMRLGRCTGFELSYPIGPAQGATSCQVTLALQVRPFSVRCTAAGVLDPTVLGLAVGVRTPLPGGTALADLTFSVDGGGATFTGFTIVVRDKSGAEVFRMPFTGAVANDERISVRSATAQIERIDGATGVVTDAYDLWDRTVTAETNDFPLLRPADADIPTGAWATAELEAGSAGTPVGTVEYWESWQ